MPTDQLDQTRKHQGHLWESGFYTSKTRFGHRGRGLALITQRSRFNEAEFGKATLDLRRIETMTYVDGFVAAVPTANKASYIEHAKKAGVVFKRYGALKLVETWGDDVPDGEVTSFPMAVKCQANETVVLSWILWPSKDVRDAGMQKIMADPDMQPDVNPMPFDGKRMIIGGFEMIVDE